MWYGVLTCLCEQYYITCIDFIVTNSSVQTWQPILSGISGSHGSEYEEDSLLDVVLCHFNVGFLQ
jgi:hypothetical protein